MSWRVKYVYVALIVVCDYIVPWPFNITSPGPATKAQELWLAVARSLWLIDPLKVSGQCKHKFLRTSHGTLSWYVYVKVAWPPHCWALSVA